MAKKPVTQRDLSVIRLQAARAVSAHRNAIDALEKIVLLSRDGDARELKKRPSLRPGKKGKKRGR